MSNASFGSFDIDLDAPFADMVAEVHVSVVTPKGEELVAEEELRRPTGTYRLSQLNALVRDTQPHSHQTLPRGMPAVSVGTCRR